MGRPIRSTNGLTHGSNAWVEPKGRPMIRTHGSTHGSDPWLEPVQWFSGRCWAFRMRTLGTPYNLSPKIYSQKVRLWNSSCFLSVFLKFSFNNLKKSSPWAKLGVLLSCGVYSKVLGWMRRFVKASGSFAPTFIQIVYFLLLYFFVCVSYFFFGMHECRWPKIIKSFVTKEYWMAGSLSGGLFSLKA